MRRGENVQLCEVQYVTKLNQKGSGEKATAFPSSSVQNGPCSQGIRLINYCPCFYKL